MSRQHFGHKPVGDFIKFIPMGTSASGKTNIWHVVNLIRPEEPDQVGIIRWYGGWRKYVYDSPKDSFYDWECLRLIADFIEQKTVEHRHQRAQASIIAEQDIANKRIIQEAERNHYGTREPNERIRRA